MKHPYSITCRVGEEDVCYYSLEHVVIEKRSAFMAGIAIASWVAAIALVATYIAWVA